MTVWSVHDVYGFWVTEGGPANRGVEFVAIAIAESSLDDHAVSVTSARGLWQEEPFWANSYGITVESLFDPRTNALVAVGISNHGQNCAAWDTAYADINVSGRYGFLAYPEHGSAAANNIPYVSNVLGRNPGIPQGFPGAPPIATDINGAVARWQNIAGAQLPSLTRQLARQRTLADRIYR